MYSKVLEFGTFANCETFDENTCTTLTVPLVSAAFWRHRSTLSEVRNGASSVDSVKAAKPLKHYSHK